MSHDSRNASRAALSPRWEWLYLAAGVVMVVGLYVDGWSHGNVTRAGESLLTPWHWLIFGGYTASAMILFRIVERTRIPGTGWRGAAPRGYEFAVLMTFVYPVGAALDLVWHQVFGVEVGIEALISPTHLITIGAMAVMASAAFPSWYLADPAALQADRWSGWRPVISVTLVLGTIDFITVFNNPLSKRYGAADQPAELALGLTAFLLHSGILAGAIALLLQRRLPLPVGSITFLLALSAFGVAFLGGGLLLAVGAALIAGVVGDAFLFALRRREPSGSALVLVPPVTVAALWIAYFALVAARHGIGWTIHVWAGAIVMGTILAALVAIIALRRPR